MTRILGLSSSSCPDWEAASIAAFCVEQGLSAVDLRVGKGQRWEAQGIGPITDANVAVSFWGTDVVLGRSGVEAGLAAVDRWFDRVPAPLRVFLDARADRADVLSDLRRVADHVGGARRVLVETHAGYGNVEAILGISDAAGSGIVLDNLGLASIATNPLAEAGRLSSHVRAAQLKGFAAGAGPKPRHLPLSAMRREELRGLCASVPRDAPILIESRAGCLADDVRCLRDIEDEEERA